MIRLISHITLSAGLLLSATGITINMHFCEGNLFDLALFAAAHDCSERDGSDDTCHHGHDKDISQSINVFYMVPSKNVNSKVGETAVAELNKYKPPPPHEVVLSQIQSFLI